MPSLSAVGFGDDGFEVVRNRGELGGRERTGRLVRRRQGELGLLGAEVVEAHLKPREPIFAAFG